MRAPSLKDESGTSLTEFAIIAPLLILLVFWAQFFTDLGIFKLKLDEASRYAVWEMAAQRPTGEVAKEVQQKFANLYSPDYDTPQRPMGVLSFKSGIRVTSATIVDNQPAPFAGHIDNPSGGGGGSGVLAQVMGFFYSLLNKTVDAILRIDGFDLNGEAQATSITFQAPDTLFPSTNIGWLGFHLNDNVQPTITMTTKSAPLLVDTWKAWPSKANGGNLETSPYQTYGKPGVPEQIVSDRMQHVAFFGLNQLPVAGTVMNVVNRGLSYVGLPGLTQTSVWTSNSGPIAMLPGDRPRHGWSPGSGVPIQRGGGTYDRNDQNFFAGFDSPDPGIDRSRSTTPAAIHTDFWNPGGGLFGFSGPFHLFGSPNDGGYPRVTRSNSNKWGGTSRNNPYVKEYICRDAYYMGARTGQVQHWGKDLRAWGRAITPQCP